MNHNNARIYIGTNLSVSYIIASLLAVIVVFAISYGYLLQATVRNAVAFDQTSAKISTLNSSLGELEARYVSETSRITPEYAKELGFKEVLSSKFITRPQVGDTSTSHNEI